MKPGNQVILWQLLEVLDILYDHFEDWDDVKEYIINTIKTYKK